MMCSVVIMLVPDTVRKAPFTIPNYPYRSTPEVNMERIPTIIRADAEATVIDGDAGDDVGCCSHRLVILRCLTLLDVKEVRQTNPQVNPTPLHRVQADDGAFGIVW